MKDLYSYFCSREQLITQIVKKTYRMELPCNRVKVGNNYLIFTEKLEGFQLNGIRADSILVTIGANLGERDDNVIVYGEASIDLKLKSEEPLRINIDWLKDIKRIDETQGRTTCACTTCGKVFINPGIIDTFCSASCAKSNINEVEGSKFFANCQEVTCIICGLKTYKQVGMNYSAISRFLCCHNRDCKEILDSKGALSTVYKKVCKYCGGTFTSKGSNRTYCDNKLCKDKALKKAPEVHLKRCQVCQKQYRTTNIQSYTCSPTCSRMYAAEQKTKAYEELMNKF